eukprot:CAMPEP_0183312104 /NCGR_PEP_ID=MMETSP0160_2-20130417/40180_1 /TAXON_ID=2839 ORGANISM="Odontella Sinensis, Strain Grunow 1884" /NCGR_SAMPLE_ID=MMETSP0160_2 /ASSEMBLY_ACC=CAM_ASM_000250 /LENGTH=54 /DNA_ID=CAMNT_0025476881 /DNA_START=236 /DNA_END=397 /DNA_ORIENTATION=-
MVKAIMKYERKAEEEESMPKMKLQIRELNGLNVKVEVMPYKDGNEEDYIDLMEE